VPTAVVVIDSSSSAPDSWLHLLPVANRALLLRVLDSLEEAGVGAVGVALEPGLVPRMRRLVEAARPWGLELSWLGCGAREGLPGALAAAGEIAEAGPVLLHWGCGLFKESPRAQLGEQPVGPYDAVLLVDSTRVASPVVDLAAERLAGVTGPPRAQSRGNLAGVGLLGEGSAEAARAVEPSGAADRDLLAVLERMAKLGGRVRARPAARCWRFSGAIDAALEANRFLLEDVAVEEPECELLATDVQGPASIDHSAILEHSTIRGPVVIGPRSRLIDAYIGPYTSIGEDVCVEGAEIENSILLSGSRIRYLGGRLEASVVGPGASIGRDFRLPRALRLHVGEGARVTLT
jgi:glucose-1-phosphate thymidylyltransferase